MTSTTIIQTGIQACNGPHFTVIGVITGLLVSASLGTLFGMFLVTDSEEEES